jgi:2-C-methyl-D-erythritol 2,4-cyclodiphosphate synthase
VIRVGNGIDVHAFEHGVPLWLGGVRIPHDRGLAGHSDGDAAVHALIDALLGAASRGDIGQWFPSSDSAFRGARGVDLLRHVWQSLSSDGWQLENADVTIVCQEPRLAPHRPAMIRALASALGCPPEAISVKATTADKLGFAGRAEGVLALATVLLSK